MSMFTANGKQFLLNGEPFQIISGAMHYFRVPSCYWEDRLLKLKECGFNTVETYIAWNVHEENEGVFDFSGEKDFGKFLDIANRLGLKAIVRPGPYICAEWEMGGFPAWLLRYPDIRLRCDNQRYLEKLEKYIEAVARVIRPRLIENGGNILMLQIENEYGSFGNDKVYLRKLKDIYLKNNLNALFFTADGASPFFLEAGRIEDCLPTFTFGSKTQERMTTLKTIIGDKPAMCSEFWDGWFDHWYEEHHVRGVESICEEFEPFLKNGDNVNFYMFHGGTNFGFMNGANFFVKDGGRFCDGEYQPVVTSYDYNALLYEAGDRTPAYYAVRELISKYTGVCHDLTAKESEKRAYGKVVFQKQADLFDNLDNIGAKFYSTVPLSMEACGQNYGYILYNTTLPKNTDSEFRIVELADRANVFIDKAPFAVFERSRPHELIKAKTGDKESRLSLLVENMGRINYGSYVMDQKGIDGVKLWEIQLFHWEMVSLPMNNLERLSYEEKQTVSGLPTFYKGVFFVDEIADTFIKPEGFSKGFVVINGFNVGRYYNEAGPQKTLYVPKSCLKIGENEIIVFDSDGAKSLTAEFVSVPEL